MQYGLLGRKLSHSYSPMIHNLLGNENYELIEKEPDEIQHFLASKDFRGLNVTIPYKKTVCSLCDELTPIAKKLGAVNTVLRKIDGTLLGHNTDYFGFKTMLERSKLNIARKKVLVLGSGGVSNTVKYVLEEMFARVVIISRTGENNYSNLHLHKDAAIIVNTTPVGMFPNNGQSPIDLEQFPLVEAVFDLIYNPLRTQLLLQALQRHIIAENGLWMLVAQAAESHCMFTGAALDMDRIEQVYQAVHRNIRNIILIGMPGSGKSTIGYKLSQILSKPFTDTDDTVVQLAGKTITDIFLNNGEIEFRKLETQAISHAGKLSGHVIATGGGCVTQPENYCKLSQNGTIYWLQRDLIKLACANRPLMRSTTAETLYTERKESYAVWADHIIDNNNTLDEAIAQILSMEAQI